MMGISGDQRLTFLVKSLVFMRHVSPRLVDLKKYCDAMYTTDGSWGEISKGAFQYMRKGSILAGALMTLGVPPRPPPPPRPLASGPPATAVSLGSRTTPTEG